MKVLITGISGVIGYEFVKRFLKEGHEVVGIHKNSLPPWLQELEGTQFTAYQANLTKSNHLGYYRNYFDAIIHGATYGQPSRFTEFASETITLNTWTLQQLFQCLKPEGHFLFISSSEIYNGCTPPFTEETIGNTTPQDPRAMYIMGKMAGEAIVEYTRKKGVHATSARVALCYGPGTKRGDGRVLSTFIERCLSGEELKLHDDGKAMRTYGYVTDTVGMLMNILLKGTKSVYNIGGVSRTSIKDLALLIGKLTHTPVHLTAEHAPAYIVGAPGDVQLNLSRYLQEFGQMDFAPLEEGLIHTIEWAKQYLYPA